ncbi:kelch protein K13, putative [Plasmodium knowlesi strain H]|uniref:Kelch protein K13, putative n=3 Tax=Plasmodium knowlesi TaxID=5850 RepID=A0A5K1VN78_PLAKH|nr:kelch protein K13, putative [Plasmodium knowlesi strain H]OTN66303.1 putative Kelch protein K13 [Plasmodium knowlesi]CAA9989902.1 kelch protein K13, putative [Plasmodium knowlesi strain H]SBO24467.1 kelch protein K13, putative [Plasmodium knowlesi strain H]SBO26519.1 kelch protein K13, putative [Plasmodium knowlesi strain H]VVS79376.1 kelch protein K13, putative [Plasmodium knowlesi strain H]|eukprot:XP_002259918.1 Kelch-motif containing protein, putative [Plasmodium knowlesi strain H]
MEDEKIKSNSISNFSVTYERESGANSNSDDKSVSSSENESNSFMNLTSDKNEKTENNSFILNNSSFANMKDSFLESIDLSILDSNFDSKKDFLPSNLSKNFNNLSKENLGNKYLNKLLNKSDSLFMSKNKDMNLMDNNMGSNNLPVKSSNRKEGFMDSSTPINANEDNAMNNLKKYSNTNNINDTYEKKIIETELSDSSDFENMVGDLRITFINWLKKTQMNFIREKDKLFKDKKELEMERIRLYKEIENRKSIEEQKLHDERKKLDIDISNGYKQIKKEKEEHRKRFDEERLRFLQEIDKIKLVLYLEKEKYFQEYKNFENDKKKIVDANIATETMIDINVGGAIFETSRHTLTQQKDSFIEKLLSGRYHVTRDKQGRIFLDRDSELFRIILNFLRNPLTVPIPKDLSESEALLKEAEFYGIKFLPFPLVFCMGGFDGVEYLNSMELLDISQQCWRMCTPMSTKKAYFGSAVLNNFLYVFGGNNYDYKALFETEVYDRLRDTWFVSSNLNIPRRNNCGVTSNGRIYCIGGYDGSCIIPNVEAYDHRMKAWVEIAPLNTPRSSSMCVAFENKIYVIGGTNGERLNSIEVYDEKMNKWEQFPYALLEARSSGAAFNYLNQIYVVGGIDNEHNILDSVEQYQPFNKRWQFLNGVPEKKMNFGAATLSDSYIITGGENGDVLNSCHFFSPDTNEWQIGPSLLVPRFGHSVLIANI